MKLLKFALPIIAFSFFNSNAEEFRYVGGDISMLPTYQKDGVIYKDHDGKQIELLPYLYEIGMNAMRVRLFVNPADFQANHPGSYDPNACQSLPYIKPLCEDIINQGFDLLLDFHYSDTWADPGNQWIPEAWKNLSDPELEEAVYSYTKSSLEELKAAGVVPKFIQPGNEISYGMLWGPYGKDNNANHVWNGSSASSWQRLGRFLKSAIKACREVCPETKIVIHTERVAEVNVLTNFYSQMKALNIDYDIIGLSYYPSYHGQLAQLDKALTSLENQYPEKNIMIVETGYPLYWDLPGASFPLEFPIGTTEAAQNEYAKNLVKVLLEHPNVDGLFWWWLEYNPYGPNYSNWWNAPLFDPYTGKATPALKTIASFGSGHDGVSQIYFYGNDSERWFDLTGRMVSEPTKPGIYIHKGEKILKR